MTTMPKKEFMLVFLFLLLIFMCLAQGLSPEPVPMVQGLGCQGARGPIYAKFEDDLPPCDVIEAVYK